MIQNQIPEVLFILWSIKMHVALPDGSCYATWNPRLRSSILLPRNIRAKMLVLKVS